VGASPSEDGELLAQPQVFEGQFSSIPEHGFERGCQEKDGFNHGHRVCHDEAETSIFQKVRGFGKAQGSWNLTSRGLPLLHLNDAFLLTLSAS
jgi:hypothetical protein